MSGPAEAILPFDDAPVDDEHSSLLDFLYRCPVGIIKMHARGDVLLINAYASQILMPLVPSAQLVNLFEVLAPFTDEVRALIVGFESERGVVCTSYRVPIAGMTDRAGRSLYLTFTIHKLDAEHFLVSFFDDSERVAQDAAMAEAIEVQAHQAGRIELASSIMHDIGNALTGLGKVIGLLTAGSAWPEVSAFGKLTELVRSNIDALSSALGPGKGQALLQYCEALGRSLSRREQECGEAARQLGASIHHVQEILTIQRQLARDGVRAAREPVRLYDLVHDALAITELSLSQRDIRLDVAVPTDLPPISADRTRMIQVLINLLGNAAEALETSRNPVLDRRIEIRAQRREKGNHVRLILRDSGCGFEPALAEQLFERGATTKPQGMGLGLYTSRATIEAYGGTIRIASDGPGRGTTVTLDLPSCQAMENETTWIQS